MTEFTDLSIIEAGKLLRSGEISSRDLTKACLKRIFELEPQVHAFLTMTEEEAMFQRKPG